METRMKITLKQLLQVLIAFVFITILVANTAYATETPRYIDVPTTNGFYEYIETLAEEGIVKGLDDGTFGLYKNVSRGQAAKMIVEAKGLKAAKSPELSFSDVSNDNGFAGYIATAVDNNIFSGKGDGTFGINEPITRRQIADVMVRAFGLKAGDEKVAFYDIDVLPVATKESIHILASNGIVTGYEQENDTIEFDHAGNTSRGAFAKILVLARNTDKFETGPIAVEKVPYEIEILEPDSIGTIYMQSTYKNNTNYPITSFSMKVLLKDKNETTYLSNYDTVLPGEISPLFDTFGPNSMKMSDIEVLTIDIVLETPEEKSLYVEYDLKLNKYEYYEYRSPYTVSGPIAVEKVPYEIEILEPDSIGTIYMQSTYKNNTNYPITSFSMKVLLKDKNETTYLSNYDTVLPGEISSLFDTFGPNSMKMSDIEVLTIDIVLETPEEKSLYVEYDLKLNKYEYYEY